MPAGRGRKGVDVDEPSVARARDSTRCSRASACTTWPGDGPAGPAPGRVAIVMDEAVQPEFTAPRDALEPAMSDRLTRDQRPDSPG